MQTGYIVKISSDWFIQFEGVLYPVTDPDMRDAIECGMFSAGDTIDLDEHSIVLSDGVVSEGLFTRCGYQMERNNNFAFHCNCNDDEAYQCGREV